MRWRPRPRGRARRASRSRHHLHARQGPCSVRARDARRADEPADARHLRRSRRRSQSSACRPASIPDYLALVGDAADGYPGLPGWGAKSSARGARAIRPSRIDPGRTGGLGRQHRQSGCAGADAGASAIARFSFADLATLRTDMRCLIQSTNCSGTVRRPHSLRSPSASMPP